MYIYIYICLATVGFMLLCKCLSKLQTEIKIKFNPGKPYTGQKMKFSIKDFFSKYHHISSHLPKNSLMENFIFLCSA